MPPTIFKRPRSYLAVALLAALGLVLPVLARQYFDVQAAVEDGKAASAPTIGDGVFRPTETQWAAL